MTQSTNTLPILLSGILWAASSQAQIGGDFILHNGQMRGAVIPLYVGSEPQPALVVRADRIFRDFQEKGFFRMGILPVAVMDGVTLEIRDVHSLSNSLFQLRQWLGPQAASHLELRHATVEIAAGVTNRLQAGRVRILPGGRLQLDDSVRFHAGTTRIRAGQPVARVNGNFKLPVSLSATLWRIVHTGRSQ